MSRASFWSWMWLALALVAMVGHNNIMLGVAIVCSTVWAAADWVKAR